MKTFNDTIVALSSSAPAPAINGGVPHDLPTGIIRLSGPRAFDLVCSVFSKERPVARKPETLILKPETTSWRREAGAVCWRSHTLNAALYTMPAPRSYTREDVAELHVPALPWLLSSLLDALTEAGARIAQPGEFTRRAFENGRISLEQAQAVGALIASASADEARAHAAQLRGHGAESRRKLRVEIEELLSQVELGLDFAHEDVVVLPREKLVARLEALRELMSKAASHMQQSAAASETIHTGLRRVLLVGPTNAGKSSLFNALLKRDAAIVSPQEHTTRDTIEAQWAPGGGRACLLIDSAGSGPPQAPLNEAGENGALQQAGWNATTEAIMSADIVLVVLDRFAAAHDQCEIILAALERAQPAALAIVFSKSDLRSDTRIDPNDTALARHRVVGTFNVSSVTGEGLGALSSFVASEHNKLGAHAHAEAATTARAASRDAAAAIGRAIDAANSGAGEDVIAVELREALHAFWQAEGILMRHDAVTEGALDRIFARFCIGK